MSKVIVVSYTDGDYEPYFELYSYSPAIVETLKENLKKYLLNQGFYFSTVKDWKEWEKDIEWAQENIPVYASTDETTEQEVEITWENIEKNDVIFVTDDYNISVRIWKKEVVEMVESFDFSEE